MKLLDTVTAKPQTRATEKKARLDVEPLEDRVLLSVYGADDRIKVTNTTDFPYKTMGRLSITFPSGDSFVGTGTLIGAKHVLTAGHCVYDASEGGWATSIKFTPGQNGTSKPYGSANATYMNTYTGWTNSKDRNWDMALITLDKRIGDTTGWLQMKAETDSFFTNRTLHVAGYPTDKGGTTVYRGTGPVGSVNSSRIYYNGTMDTAGGMSGGAVWRHNTTNNERYIVGVHVAGDSSVGNVKYNTAVRLTAGKIADLERWMRESQANTRGVGEAGEDPSQRGGGLELPDAVNGLPEPSDAPPPVINPPSPTPAPAPTPTPTPRGPVQIKKIKRGKKLRRGKVKVGHRRKLPARKEVFAARPNAALVTAAAVSQAADAGPGLQSSLIDLAFADFDGGEE